MVSGEGPMDAASFKQQSTLASCQTPLHMALDRTT